MSEKSLGRGIPVSCVISSNLAPSLQGLGPSVQGLGAPRATIMQNGQMMAPKLGLRLRVLLAAL